MIDSSTFKEILLTLQHSFTPTCESKVTTFRILQLNHSPQNLKCSKITWKWAITPLNSTYAKTKLNRNLTTLVSDIHISIIAFQTNLVTEQSKINANYYPLQVSKRNRLYELFFGIRHISQMQGPNHNPPNECLSSKCYMRLPNNLNHTIP